MGWCSIITFSPFSTKVCARLNRYSLGHLVYYLFTVKMLDKIYKKLRKLQEVMEQASYVVGTTHVLREVGAEEQPNSSDEKLTHTR